MAQFQNIAERVLAVTEKKPDGIAIVLPDRTVSYARIRHLTLSYAAHARLHGIGRGSLVAIDVDNLVMHTALSLACALIGAASIHASPTVIRRKLPWTHLLFGRSRKHEESATRILVDETWSVAPPGPPAALDPCGPNDIFSYAESSGTTGETKFSPFTFGVIEEALNKPVDLPEGMQPVIATLAPLGSAASIPVGFLALGITAVCGATYERMLEAGTNLVGGSPVQYAALLRNAKPPQKRIYMAAFGGAAANEALIVRMLDFFENIKVMYGTTEIGMVAERIIDSLPYDPTNVGKIVPPAEVMVVDDNDQPVPVGQEGFVRIRRADIPWNGYADAEGVARSPFRDGWFYPGDIGRFSEAGDLYMLGRRDDRLNVGGVKADAVGIDAVVQSTQGVRDGYCFEDVDDSGASYLALVLVLDEPDKPYEIFQRIYKALNASGRFPRIRRAYLADEIPRTETGKPLRRLAPDFVRKQKRLNIVLRRPSGV